jgi:hypothetical protein
MTTRRSGQASYYVRRRTLGTEAVYRVLDERGLIADAEVVRAPGLEPGTRVRLMARDVRRMERFDPTTEQPVATQRVKAQRRVSEAAVSVEAVGGPGGRPGRPPGGARTAVMRSHEPR